MLTPGLYPFILLLFHFFSGCPASIPHYVQTHDSYKWQMDKVFGGKHLLLGKKR